MLTSKSLKPGGVRKFANVCAHGAPRPGGGGGPGAVTGHATGTPALVAHDETSRGPGTGPPTRHVRITVSAARAGPGQIPSRSSNPTLMAAPRLLHPDLRFGEKVR